jgi:hypothetical protein
LVGKVIFQKETWNYHLLDWSSKIYLNYAKLETL